MVVVAGSPELVLAEVSCRKLALRVLQKKGTDPFRRSHAQVRAETGEQVTSTS